MAAKLVAEEGSLKGLVLSLEDGDHWVIGRDPDACQLLIEDPLASRKHLMCRMTPQGIVVENLSTTNPIQVNEEEIKEPRLLQNGDTVKIGGGLFRFYAEAAAQLIKDANDTSNPSNVENIDGQEVKQEQEAASPDVVSNESTPSSPEAQAPQSQQEIATETKKQENNESPTPSPAEAALASIPPPPEKDEERHDSIFDEPSEKSSLAEINFGILDTGRWLLKVVGGPNNGAEFSMQSGNSYVIGTDPNACDIVFHDTSVSRQHARITIGEDDVISIEDLKSRNGTVVEGESLKAKHTLAPNILVSVGTSSFVVYDREGEMQTIISPLMPSIVNVLKTEEPKTAEEQAAADAAKANAALDKPSEALPHPHTTFGAFILIGILTGLLVIIGIGTSTLFKSEPIVHAQVVDPTQALDSALAPFPNVKYTYNKSTGQLLLVGHVLTASDRSQLLYALQGLNFVKSLDDSGIVIDEFVWREVNQILDNNPDWKGINVMSSTPGHFVVSGYLKTRNQADHLSEYLNANFPYPDLLEKKFVVDEDVQGSINSLLQNKGLRHIVAKVDNGEVLLSGGVPTGKEQDFATVLDNIKGIRGIRNVRDLTVTQAPELTMVNISDKYEVSGMSNQAGKLNVVINGRILTQGDVLDGMAITKIQPNAVFLQKEGMSYRIDINR